MVLSTPYKISLLLLICCMHGFIKAPTLFSFFTEEKKHEACIAELQALMTTTETCNQKKYNNDLLLMLTRQIFKMSANRNLFQRVLVS